MSLLEVSDVHTYYGESHILEERRQQDAGTLSGGQQQMLAIARGLVGDNEMLLADEPSEGLAGVAGTFLIWQSTCDVTVAIGAQALLPARSTGRCSTRTSSRSSTAISSRFWATSSDRKPSSRRRCSGRT